MWIPTVLLYLFGSRQECSFAESLTWRFHLGLHCIQALAAEDMRFKPPLMVDNSCVESSGKEGSAFPVHGYKADVEVCAYAAAGTPAIGLLPFARANNSDRQNG